MLILCATLLVLLFAVVFMPLLLLAMLPPGAFIGLGLMLAVKYVIDEKMKARKAQATAADATPKHGEPEKAS